MLDETNATIGPFLDHAHGISAMNARCPFALGISKTEDASIPSANQPSTEHTTAGVPCGHALPTLCEMKMRLAAHNAVRGGRAGEHCKSIEIPHEIPWSA